jgi:hypothetical protein
MEKTAFLTKGGLEMEEKEKRERLLLLKTYFESCLVVDETTKKAILKVCREAAAWRQFVGAREVLVDIDQDLNPFVHFFLLKISGYDVRWEPGWNYSRVSFWACPDDPVLLGLCLAGCKVLIPGSGYVGFPTLRLTEAGWERVC